MGCQELRQLLNTDWRGNDSLSSCIATHVRSCADCHHGLVVISVVLAFLLTMKPQGLSFH